MLTVNLCNPTLKVVDAGSIMPGNIFKTRDNKLFLRYQNSSGDEPGNGYLELRSLPIRRSASAYSSDPSYFSDVEDLGPATISLT